MVHSSWHQSHCDLYRIFLTGYRDAAPSVVLTGIDRAYIAFARQLCLAHAELIVQILSDFLKQYTNQCVLEFDTAICAYHALRIILYMAHTDGGRYGLTMEVAIGKAQICLAAITHLFASSVVVEPVVGQPNSPNERIVTFSLIF
jgi:hypothetical protein